MPIRRETITYADGFPFEVLMSMHPQKLYPHYHPQIEFMYFYKTSGVTYTCRGKEILVSGGELVVANPWEIHECADFGDSCVCCITASRDLICDADIRFCNLISDEKVTAVFDEIRAAEGSGKAFRYIAASCVYRLFSVIVRDYVAERVSESGARLANRIQRAMSLVTELVNDGKGDSVTIPLLAAYMNLSVGRFSHVFAEVSGMSPGDFIEKEKLVRARRLLGDTGMSVLEIALDCGFSDNSYFSKRFKLCTGMTPTEYRKRRG